MDLAGSGDPGEAYPTAAGEVEGDEEMIWPATDDEIDLADEKPTDGADVRAKTSRVQFNGRVGSLVRRSFGMNQRHGDVRGAGAYLLAALLTISAARLIAMPAQEKGSVR